MMFRGHSMKFARRFGAIAALALAMAAPTPAYAFESLIEIAMTKASEFAQVAAKESAMVAKWMWEKKQSLSGEQSSAESIVAAIEKSIAGDKELAQAKINYKAASATNANFQAAQDAYTSDAAQGFKTCETVSETSTVAGSAGSSREIAIAETVKASKRNLHTTNALVDQRATLADYREKFCSVDDAARYGCTAVRPAMQGAGLRAASLLTPATNETYSEDERQAAMTFVKLLVNPFPTEVLPKGLDKKKPAAERFNLAMMVANAELSIAEYSFGEILGSHTAMGIFSSTADGSSAEPVSKVGLMRQHVDKKYGDPDYLKSLQGMNEASLLREAAVQMAAHNWMQFQGYTQDERTEALIAARLGVLAGERNARQTALARSNVGDLK